MAHEAPHRSSVGVIAIAVVIALLVGAGVAYILQQRRVSEVQAQLVTAEKAVKVADAKATGLQTQVAALEAKVKKLRRVATKTTKELKEQKQAAEDAQAEAEKASTDLPDGKYYGALKAAAAGAVDVDIQQFLTGKAAEKAAERDNTEVTNDIYIVNESKQVRELPVVGSATVKILKSSGSPQHKTISYSEFVKMFNSSSKSKNYVKNAGYWLWLDGGKIVRLEAQYTP